MKSMAIRRPNNSPAKRVNRLIMEQAPKIAIKHSNSAVHTQTLITFGKIIRKQTLRLKTIGLLLLNKEHSD